MPNIASILKTEISRIARKELRSEIASLRKAVTAHRTDLARLKREQHALEQEIRKLRRQSGGAMPKKDDKAPAIRYSAERLAAVRQRLGLSAADFGLLVNASGLTVYKWERGAKPRERFMPALSSVWNLGKREVRRRLAALKQK